jgi:hypothetical protein
MSGRIWYRGFVLATGNKISNLKTRAQKITKFYQQLSKYEAPFWYSKVDLGRLGRCSIQSKFRVGPQEKQHDRGSLIWA